MQINHITIALLPLGLFSVSVLQLGINNIPCCYQNLSWLLQYCTLVPVTCDNPFYSPDGSTVGRLGNLTKWRPAASDLIIVSLVVVIIYFLNCFNNFSRFWYSYMYIMMFITYICIFSDKLPSYIQTFGLLLILSRFIGLPRYSYQPRKTGISDIFSDWNWKWLRHTKHNYYDW